tara:strand:- start:1441 stop:3009 length:1569 start_codon:yes stop_codon:yes gene_type:complete
MNAAVAQKPYEVPNGGLASFLTATTGDWSDEALNGLDYEIIRPTADQLAEFGREGDNRIAHVADGETVIPMEVFQEDPALKEALFDRMREMGIDPERYVVGNQLNSINPVTGQPEFFLKKLFKGVKKAVKGVVKVFKKIAPIVLSVGLNFLFPGLGAIAAGALGSGIGTLVQGGNLKDAFKAALIGGAVGGISSGIGSVMKGGDFMSGVKGALPGGAPGAPVPIEKGVPDFVAPEAAGAEVMPPQNVAEAAVQESMQAAGGVPDMSGPTNLNMAGPTNLDMSPIPGAKQAQLAQQAKTAAGAEEALASGADAASTSGADAAAAEVADKSFVSKAFDFIKGASDPTNAEIFASAEYKELIANGFSPAEAFAQAQKTLAPGLLAKYGPMAAVGLGAMGLAGGFKAQDPVQPYDAFGGMTGFDLLRMYPDRYAISQPGSNYAQVMGLAPGGAANGGDISSFPRRNGAIRGPGTETSDDIPAMLSDGEFVMTARAVRGAGNGSRQEGMQKMYDMMRTFEGRAPRGN